MKFGISATTVALVAAAVAVPTHADPSITSFTIVDADTNLDYMTLSDGQTLYRDNVPMYMNLRADYDQSQTIPGSVQFFVDGTGPVRTENLAPFALAGDTPPGYYYVDSKYLINDATFTVMAKPFQTKNAGGTEYPSASITFTIEEGDAPIIAHDDTCITDFAFTDTGERCTFEKFTDLLATYMSNNVGACGGSTVEAEIGYLLNMPGAPMADLEIAFEAICEDALDIHEGFNEVMMDNDVDVTEYFNGGTYWNEGRESYGINGKPSDRLKSNPGRKIRNFYNGYAQTRPMIWPSEITNFNSEVAVGDMKNCEHRAAMCCWVQDRQAGDNNGNCNTPYDDNCRDADPADNTDICYHDMSLSPESARVANGISVFLGDNADGEGDAHCHGFAWNDDETDIGNLFKANNLFYVSMYDHLYQRGYVRNVPGAPMCGCIEQMPTVTRSDCTQIDVVDVDTDYTFNANGNNEFVVVADITIEFNSCDVPDGQGADNDLYSYYDVIIDRTPAQLEFIKTKLVGPVNNGDDSNCREAIAKFVSNKFGIEGITVQ